MGLVTGRARVPVQAGPSDGFDAAWAAALDELERGLAPPAAPEGGSREPSAHPSSVPARETAVSDFFVRVDAHARAGAVVGSRMNPRDPHWLPPGWDPHEPYPF